MTVPTARMVSGGNNHTHKDVPFISFEVAKKNHH